MDRMMLISSDCHAGAPTEDYHLYLESKYLPAYEDFMAERKVRQEAAAALTSQPLQTIKDTLQARYEYSTQLERRLDALEHDGFVAEVLFPDGEVNNDIPFTGRFGVPADYPEELSKAGLRAYNRWLGEHCAPNRQIGLALIPTYDPEYALAEVRRARAMGLLGIMPQWDGLNVDHPPLHHPSLDPVWAAAAEEGLHLHFHSGTGMPARVSRRGTDVLSELQRSCEAMFWSRRPLWQVILGGVAERHPNLQFVFTELWADWIPRTLESMNWLWRNQGNSTVREILPLSPSEYWERQCHVGATTASIQENLMRHELGVHKYMFGTDFPHAISPMGGSNAFLRATVGVAGVPEAEARAMLGENAAKFYNLDVAKLAPIVDRVGPLPSQILVPSPGGGDAETLTPYVQRVVDRPLSMN
jgi:predicted TIM-barrel fold metal-dependent hydrolase